MCFLMRRQPPTSTRTYSLYPYSTYFRSFMNYCYILFSNKLNRFYTGASHNDLNERILKHNDHSYGNHRFTAKANDWELFLSIECESFAEARRIELHIKKMKSSNYIRNLKKYQEIIEKLKSSV